MTTNTRTGTLTLDSRSRSGDANAQDRLFEEVVHNIEVYAFSLGSEARLPPGSNRHDVIQEAHLDVLRALAKLESRSKSEFWSWVHVMDWPTRCPARAD